MPAASAWSGAGAALAAWVRTALLAALPLIGILWLFDLPFRIGMSVVTATYLSLMIGIATAAGYLLHPFGRRAGWVELALGAAGLAAWIWGGVHHEDWLVSFGPRGPEQWIPGVVALGLMIEAMRRACGNAVTAVVVVLGAYAFLGHHLGGDFEAPYTPPARVVMYFYADTNGVPGMILGVAATVVLGFIIMGAVMGAVGASAFFTDLALAAMGARRGGPAKVAVVASTLFGTISGSTVGNVMTTGVVTIPLMKRTGFKPHVAAAIEAVASNGGQLAPPVMGATAFLIAEFLQVPYVQVVLAAVIPAAIYYLVLFMQVDLIAQAEGLHGLPRAELPRAGAVLRAGWLFLVPIGLLIWLLFWKGFEPGKSALYTAAAMAAAGLAARGRSLGLRPFLMLLPDAGRPLTVLILICGAAGIVVGALNLTGVGFLLTNTLAGIGQAFGQLPMLLVTALIAIVLGMGMPTAAVYIVLSIILAPALVRMGIEEMAAHLFIFYFGLLSMLTPPVAVASYTAGALAGASLWQTGLAGMRLGAGAFLLPFLFAENPALVGHGTPWQVALAIVTVVAGSYLLARALSPAPSGAAERVLLVAAAVITGTATLVLGPDSPLALIPAAATAVYALGGHQRLSFRIKGDRP
ncbi:MAG: TRAP transporter fused permease subunit [Alphaproteobacteria bacterium]|nr:MAG: TRAP transporter fused permease subunit [Alphaproteobacteria bacterium]